MADPRIIAVEVDERSLAARTGHLAQERQVAIVDLVENSHFAPHVSPPDGYDGPYRIGLAVEDGRLVLAIARADGAPLERHVLALGRFKRPVRDYLAMCDSFGHAAPPHRMETIDMARRALHNDGAQLLRDRLAGKIDLDVDTARRLFTLLCVLHLKG